MKVILLTDVKGKGKKDDIKELANGYANFLITHGQAVLATEENINKLKQEKENILKQEALHLEAMRQLKAELEKKTVTIVVRVGANGKLFGSVSTKLIADMVEEQLKLKIDKKKMDFNGNISAVGIYDIPIQLHREVIANLKINVIAQ